MKAIIPVAGAGTKLRPHSYTQPKALIPLAGKTVLSIIIDQMREAGIQEFVFIVGYLGDKIRDYVKAKYPELHACYVQQIDRQGIGHAIQMTKEVVNNDEVVVVLGDTICEYDISEVVNSPGSMLGVKKVDDPREFGVAEIDEDGYIDHAKNQCQIEQWKKNGTYDKRFFAYPCEVFPLYDEQYLVHVKARLSILILYFLEMPGSGCSFYQADEDVI